MGKEAILPPRPFLYTLDQVATLTGVTMDSLVTRHVFFEGRSTGVRSPERLCARSITPRTEKPDWRISESELARWLKRLGFKVYERQLRL
jgi:hypothetical protein